MASRHASRHGYGSRRSDTSLRELADAATVDAPAPGPPRTQAQHELRCVNCKLRKVKCSGAPSPCRSCGRLGLACTFTRPEDAQSDSSPRLVAPTDRLTEAGTPRRRTIRACQECRHQKVKCSGQLPICRRCGERNLSCLYPANSLGRRLRTAQAGCDADRAPASGPLVSPAASGSGSLSAASPSTPPSDPMRESETLPEGLPYTLSLNTATQHHFLKRDVLSQHIDAYFVYIYCLPAYNFFHKPSMLEDLYHDRIPPPLCTAICAVVAMYLSQSRESKRLAISWAKEVDAYLFSNLNKLTLLNLQIMILSMFQHFAYRQFGRVWLITGMTTKLAMALQLNKKDTIGMAGEEAPMNNVAARECVRRVAWSIFLRDKQHSGGVDEFVALPPHLMRIPLPVDEDDFLYERDRQVGTIFDSIDSLSKNGLGINGYMVLIMNSRHRILKLTKAVIARREAASEAEVEEVLSPLLALQGEYTALYQSLPTHLTLSDRSVFSYSTRPEFATFISLHTWYIHGCCDIFRICLPGAYRESASPDFLAYAPEGFVAQWRSLTVSYAWKLATMWERLLDLKKSGSLILPGGFVPLSPEGCHGIHQCTKILLVARSYQLYSGLKDPMTKTPVRLDDETVYKLCQSNVAFLDDLASIAPIAAVVRQDVKTMIERAMREGVEGRNQAPVTSDIQREKILSRYHVLTMGIAATNEPAGPAPTAPESTPSAPASTSEKITTGHGVARYDATHPPHRPPIPLNPSGNPEPSTEVVDPAVSAQVDLNRVIDPVTGQTLVGNYADGYWATPAGYMVDPLIDNVGPDYTIAASQSDMDGELDWFLSQTLYENQAH